MIRKIATHFHALREKLLDLRDLPHALAGGVAIGMFIGFTPLFGLKTLLCIGLAYLFRCNPIAAVISVSLTDVVTPLWPVILELEYNAGRAVLRLLHEVPPAPPNMHFSIHEVMQWRTFLDMGLPMLAGSLFISIPAALISYWLSLPLFRQRALRRQP